MTRRIESIYCVNVRKKPETESRRRRRFAHGARRARSALADLAPVTPPPCAFSPCALTRTLERGAQGTRRATIGGENSPK